MGLQRKSLRARDRGRRLGLDPDRWLVVVGTAMRLLQMAWAARRTPAAVSTAPSGLLALASALSETDADSAGSNHSHSDRDAPSHSD